MDGVRVLIPWDVAEWVLPRVGEGSQQTDRTTNCIQPGGGLTLV